MCDAIMNIFRKKLFVAKLQGRLCTLPNKVKCLFSAVKQHAAVLGFRHYPEKFSKGIFAQKQIHCGIFCDFRAIFGLYYGAVCAEFFSHCRTVSVIWRNLLPIKRSCVIKNIAVVGKGLSVSTEHNSHMKNRTLVSVFAADCRKHFAFCRLAGFFEQGKIAAVEVNEHGVLKEGHKRLCTVAEKVVVNIGMSTAVCQIRKTGLRRKLRRFQKSISCSDGGFFRHIMHKDFVCFWYNLRRRLRTGIFEHGSALVIHKNRTQTDIGIGDF